MTSLGKGEGKFLTDASSGASRHQDRLWMHWYIVIAFLEETGDLDGCLFSGRIMALLGPQYPYVCILGDWASEKCKMKYAVQRTWSLDGKM